MQEDGQQLHARPGKEEGLPGTWVSQVVAPDGAEGAKRETHVVRWCFRRPESQVHEGG